MQSEWVHDVMSFVVVLGYSKEDWMNDLLFLTSINPGLARSAWLRDDATQESSNQPKTRKQLSSSNIKLQIDHS